jgi:hypothetical protein
MPGKTDEGMSLPEQQLRAGNSLQARRSGTATLPTWESFPVGDRDRLVRQILRTARRQVEAGPIGRLPTA